MTTDQKLTLRREVLRRVNIDGERVEEIAKSMNLPVMQVTAMLHKAQRKQRRLSKLDDPNSNFTIHLLHLERLESQWREVMHSWRLSKTDAEKHRVIWSVKSPGGDKDPEKLEKLKESQTGDVKYLQQAREIMAEIRELSKELAALTPKEHDREHPFTFNERIEEFHRLLVEGGQSSQPTPDDGVDVGRATSSVPA